MATIKINFTPDRIKYKIYELAKTSVFENNGVIFGGFARDMIISDHYKTIYNSTNGYNIHKFWNKYHQPETAARAMIAKDMDICMYSLEDVDTFTTALKNIFNERAGYANVTLKDTTVSKDSCYFGIPINIHKRISVKTTVGKIPFVYSGVDLTFDFDIIVPRRANVQPPFNRIDMLSNVFILTKQGITISNNTGTIIDKMSIINKQKISGLIMSDIVEFKTQFCLMNYTDNYACGSFRYNMKVCERLNKMLFRQFPWKITNLPLALEQFSGNNEANSMCCICHSDFKDKQKIAVIHSDNSTKTEKICTMMAHSMCLFKYFDTQIDSAKADMLTEAENFQFRCPMRNVINFKTSAKNIDAIISEKMSGNCGAKQSSVKID